MINEDASRLFVAVLSKYTVIATLSKAVRLAEEKRWDKSTQMLSKKGAQAYLIHAQVYLVGAKRLGRGHDHLGKHGVGCSCSVVHLKDRLKVIKNRVP